MLLYKTITKMDGWAGVYSVNDYSPLILKICKISHGRMELSLRFKKSQIVYILVKFPHLLTPADLSVKIGDTYLWLSDTYRKKLNIEHKLFRMHKITL